MESPTFISTRISPAPIITSTVTKLTNSLVVTGLPLSFFHPVVLEALRNHFATYGEIYAWAPIRSFARVILVYFSEVDAEKAKLGSDGLRIDATSESAETVLRVYRADPTPICSSHSSSPSSRNGAQSSSVHLRPPAVEKNFLISPPGSPPVGWEPVREEPPNNTPLAEDLIMALRRLQFSQEGPSNSSISVLLEPEEGPGVGVYVEDCGDDEVNSDEEEGRLHQGEGWFYGSYGSSKRRFAPIPARMPPLPTAV